MFLLRDKRRGLVAASIVWAASQAIAAAQPPQTQPVQAPQTHTVQVGDTLWTLSEKYLGSFWQWPKLWSYNPQVTNPHWIYPGNLLRIQAGGAAVAAKPLLRNAPARPGRRLSRSRLRDYAYLDRQALAAAGSIVGSPEEHMLLAPQDTLYVRFAKASDARAGQIYSIFRVVPKQERDRREEGDLVRIYGTLRLRNYDAGRRLGEAEVLDGIDPIERGYLIAKQPRTFAELRPIANAVGLQAKVVGTLYAEEMVGSQQVVFANVGSQQGVREGNRFFVVRRGDPWRQNLDSKPTEYGATPETPAALASYPGEIIGEAQVVRARPQTATLWINRATQEIELGDRLEMRKGY